MSDPTTPKHHKLVDSRALISLIQKEISSILLNDQLSDSQKEELFRAVVDTIRTEQP